MKSKQRSSFILVFLLTILITGCDPNASPFLVVNRVVVLNNTPYLLVLERCSWGIGCPSSQQHRYFMSSDQGKTWQELSSSPFVMPPVIGIPAQVQATTCVPYDSNICYRVTGGEQIDSSMDGGQTWQVDWQQPIGRKTYMQRDQFYTSLLHVEPDTIPSSIGIIEKKDTYFVIASLGNQGVLVKSENRSWERYAVSPSIPSSVPDYAMPSNASIILPTSATPIGYSATSFSEIKQSLSSEVARILLTALIFFINLSIFRWRRARSDKSKFTLNEYEKPNNFTLWIGVSFLIYLLQYFVILFYPILPLSYIENINDFFNVIVNFPVISICLITIIGLSISWLLIANIPKIAGIKVHNLRVDIGYTLLLFLCALFPLVLWSIGIIPIYETALIFSLILGSIIIFFGFRNKKLIAGS